MLSHKFIDKDTDLTLILFHGIAANKDQLTFFWELPYSILAIDLPGSGDGESSSLPLHTLEIDTKKLIKKYAIDHYVLLGYSLGGYIVQHLILKGYEPKGIIIVSSGMHLRGKSLLERWPLLDTAHSVVEKHEDVVKKLLEFYRKMRGIDLDISDRHLQADVLLAKQLLNEDFTDVMSQNALPLLVLHGSKDTIVPLDDGKELAECCPTCEFFELEEDHETMITSVKARNRVKKFLEKIS